MCVNIEVVLPTVERFLLLYPLRCGTNLILIWTMLRSSFCFLLLLTIILEGLIGEKSPVGVFLVTNPLEIVNLYTFYYTLVLLMLCEGVLLISMLHLAVGVFHNKAILLEHYLICRIITWLIEVVGYFILCVVNKALIAWYLGILCFVFLELYSFIVVYSFYVILLEDEKDVC